MSEQQRGRPRSDVAHHAILEATRVLLISSGYEQLTMEAIAAEAGVGKTTVYRRWGSKASVVAEAVTSGLVAGPGIQLADTGDVEADLRHFMREQVQLLNDPTLTALVRATAAASADSESDAGRLYDTVTGPGRKILLDRLTTAVGQGQVRAETDLDAVVSAIFGVLLYNVLSRRTTDADDVIDVIFAGITPRPA